MFLNWVDAVSKANGPLRLLKPAGRPASNELSAIFNGITWALDKLDATQAPHGNVLPVAPGR